MQKDTFSAGAVVYFRILGPDGTLARWVDPTAREVEFLEDSGIDGEYVAKDGDGNFLGSFPRDFVAAILPLATVGPSADSKS